MSRSTQPSKAVELLLTRLQLQLPDQPPPRLSAQRKTDNHERDVKIVVKTVGHRPAENRGNPRVPTKIFREYRKLG